MTAKLEVEKRTQSAAVVRESGKVPAIVYGPKQEPIQLAIDAHTFTKTMSEAGEATIISLMGLDEEIEVLIQDVAFNPARGGVEHVDFYAIERGKELTTNVPLEFVGEAPATKNGAVVTRAIQEVEVTCRPSVLPSNIEVDLTVLVDESSQIKVSDLVVPEDVKIDTDGEITVATVAAAREEEPEEVVEVDMDAIEVEAKGKDEESGESTETENEKE